MKRRKTRRLTALAAALALTAALAAPASAAQAGEESGIEGASWEEMEYVHADPTDFYEGTDELTALAAGEDADAILALYDQLHEQLLWMYTYHKIADIHFNMDVTDEYWSEEDTYSEGLVMDTDDAFCTACNAVMNGPCAQALAEHVGQEAAAYYETYVPATDRESALAERESALINEYYTCLNERSELTYSYAGRDWTEEDLYGAAGGLLYDLDPDGYDQVSEGLAAALNEQVGELYLELVQIRREQAQIWGYDNYAEALYTLFYDRDYTPEDAQALCQAVKPLAREYYDGLYYSELWNMAGDVSPVLDAQEQIEVLGQYVGRIDPALHDVWRMMTQRDLYWLTDDPDSVDSGFTATIYSYGCPYIYNRMYDDCTDLDNLVHEFGHFADAYLNPETDPVTALGSNDLFEIHSTGLEALFTAYYGEIYDDGADAALFSVLDNLIMYIITGCVHDEFQRRVYAQEDLTLDEVNEIYTAVCREYGAPVSEPDYNWQEVPHNFDNPLYYISYAVSALAALQIWDEAQTDWDGAVETYMDVLGRGAYGDGYMQVLSACGLRLFTEEGAVEEICRPVLDYMQALDDGTADVAA